MILRVGKPWRLMLAVNAAVPMGVFLSRSAREPYVPYIHLWFDYSFRFTKRALIGRGGIAVFPQKFRCGWCSRCRVLSADHIRLFVKLFRRTFWLRRCSHAAVRVHGRLAFFLKNFMHTLGHFDIYGCAFAICLLLLPARLDCFGTARSPCIVILILIHHIHLLMYVPTIAVIVVLVTISCTALAGKNAIAGTAAIACIACCSSPRNSGSLAYPKRVRPASCKPHGPTLPDHLLSFSYIWYQPLLGNSRYLGPHAVKPARIPSFALPDLAACPAVEIFC